MNKNKNHVKMSFVCTCFVFLFSFASCAGKDLQIDSSAEEAKKFDVELISVEVVDEASQSVENFPEKRLLINVSIKNNTEFDFEDMGFRVSLNEEAKPYLADQILFYEYSGDYILSRDKCEKYKEDGIEDIDGKMYTWGYDYTFGKLLTSEEDLQNYYSLSQYGIYDAINTLYVDIWWDGGEQHEEFDIEIRRE